jgi:hypothetical protein
MKRKYDFSKPETHLLYEAEVRKRVDRFGMTRQQAEMLVAVLMTEPPKVYGTLTRPPPGQDGTLMAEPEYEDDDVGDDPRLARGEKKR